MLDSSNKVLILGSNSSLGKSIVNELQKRNVQLILHQRVIEEKINHHHHKYIYGDLNEKNFLDIFEKVLSNENPNIYINCCASHSSKAFKSISDERIKEIINLNITIPTLLLKRVYCHFLSNNIKGSIINIGSIAASYDAVNESIYSMTKCAMQKLHRCIRLECLNESINVINVLPGAFKSKMTQKRENFENLPEPIELAKLIVQVMDLENFNVNEIEIRKINKSV